MHNVYTSIFFLQIAPLGEKSIITFENLIEEFLLSVKRLKLFSRPTLASEGN